MKQENTETGISKNKVKTETEEDDSKPFPVLNGLQNAMEFFLEYDKKHILILAAASIAYRRESSKIV